MSFDKAFELLMVNEVNGMPDRRLCQYPADPGGETKYAHQQTRLPRHRYCRANGG